MSRRVFSLEESRAEPFAHALGESPVALVSSGHELLQSLAL
jgi:hypothetical protein